MLKNVGIPVMKIPAIPSYHDSMLFLLQLGLEQHHAVGIIGFNSPEWFMADLGAIFAG